MVSSEKKWKISAMAALVFCIIASPQLYNVTGNLLTIKDPIKLLIIHSIVYMLVTRAMMM